MVVTMAAIARGAADADDGAATDYGVQINWVAVNSSINIDLESGNTSRQMSLSGQLQFPINRTFAGYAIRLTDVSDAAGRSMIDHDANHPGHDPDRPPSYNRIQQNVGQGAMQGINVSLSNLHGRVASIASIRGVVDLLEVTAKHEVDVPLVENGAWTPVIDDIKIRIIKIDKRNNFLNIDYASSATDPQSLNDINKLPLLLTCIPMDAPGKPTAIQSTPYFYNSNATHGSIRFYLGAPNADPKLIHLVLATKTTPRRIDFHVHDLLKPDKPKKPKHH